MAASAASTTSRAERVQHLLESAADIQHRLQQLGPQHAPNIDELRRQLAAGLQSLWAVPLHPNNNNNNNNDSGRNNNNNNNTAGNNNNNNNNNNNALFSDSSDPSATATLSRHTNRQTNDAARGGGGPSDKQPPQSVLDRIRAPAVMDSTESLPEALPGNTASLRTLAVRDLF